MRKNNRDCYGHNMQINKKIKFANFSILKFGFYRLKVWFLSLGCPKCFQNAYTTRIKISVE